MRQVGDRLGRYTLLKRLAVGGMGEVFVAAKPGPVGFGPYVALKILRDELACDPQFVDMLVDEANISMFLNHQNVVSVLDLSEDQGAYYIAMEYVQGITVERMVDALVSSGEKLDLPHTLYIAVELCRALKYAHTRVNHKGEPLNIIHRDVTPANILLSIQGEVKLTDFGIARARGRIHQTQAGVLKGKFGYMAPEMVRYERIDARADLFCAGVVMYLMMSGRHPVAGAAVMEAIQRFEQKRIPPPSHFNSGIPKALDTIVMRALEPQPDQRWGSAAALGDALRDVMLQNPEWRKHAKDGGQRLVKVIRQVAPEQLEAPVPADQLTELLKNAMDEEQISAAFPRLLATDTELPTDGALPALKADGVRSTTDLETDEQLQVKDVLSAQEQLQRERGASAVVDLLEDADSSAQTAATPVAMSVDIEPDPSADLEQLDRSQIEPGSPSELIVGFLDSAERQPADVLAEPALPAEGPGSQAADDLADDGATRAQAPRFEETDAGFSYEEGVIDRPLRSDTDRDDRTVVSPPSDEFESHDLSVHGAESEDEGPEGEDDGKTVAGVFVPPSDDGFAAVARAQSSAARVFTPDANGATPADDDPSTVVPMFPVGAETDKQAPLSATGFGGDHDDALADATVLEGLSPHRGPSPRAATDATQAADGDGALDAVTIEAKPDDMRALTMGELLQGNDSASSQRNSEEQPLPPAAPNGPVRALMGADGEVSRIEDVSALASSRRSSLAQDTKSPQPQPFGMAPNVGAENAIQPATSAWPGPEASTERPAGPSVQGPVGMNTSRWMAGEINADALSWDDEAAARRAVATRDKVHAPVYAARPGVPMAAPPGYRHPAPGAGSFWQRNGMLVGTMMVAFGLLAILVYAIMFTQVFWPRLKLSSEPQGAVVLVDGVEAPGRTPLVVQVEPERRHRIEFRLEGYQRTLREITEGIGRAKTYTLTVAMDRLPPKVFLPVPGRVLLNGRLVGRGREVSLIDLARFKREVTLRVEANGYEPYEVQFPSAREIPPALDVPLREASK